MNHLLGSKNRGAGLLACLMAVTMPAVARTGADRPRLRPLSGRSSSATPAGMSPRPRDFGPRETGDARTTETGGITLEAIRGSFAPPSLLEAPSGLLEGGLRGKGEFWTSPNSFQHGGSGAKDAAPGLGNGPAAARASEHALPVGAAAEKLQEAAGCVVGTEGCPGGRSDGAVQTPAPVAVPTPDIAPPSATAPTPFAEPTPVPAPTPVPLPTPDPAPLPVAPVPATDKETVPPPTPSPDVTSYDPVIPEVGVGCAVGSAGCPVVGDPPALVADAPLPYVEQPILVAGGTLGPTLLPPGTVPEPQLRVLDPVTEPAAYNFARVKDLTGKARTVGLSEAEIAELRALMGETRIQEMGVGWDILVQKARTEYARRNP